MKSALWSIAKYALAVILLVLILRHAQTEKIVGYLRQMPPLRLALCLLLITLAQIAAALRMRFFFRAKGFPIQWKFAVILFYVGAFYNFLLPGGIGGDAYKIMLARKRMNVTVKQGIRIMLADRASGLCVLMIIMFGALMGLDFSGSIPYARAAIAACMAVTVAAYLFFSWLIIRLPPSVMIASLPYSIPVHGLWITTLLLLLSTLNGGANTLEYVALYCASGITGMLPVSVGGLGIKEMTYYAGAQQLRHFAHSGVDGELGIALSLCVFFLMFAASLPGLLWLNRVEKADHS